MMFLDSGNKAHLLLISNDRLTQKSLYEMLSRKDYKVDIAPTVEIALNKLDKKNFQAILADMDGVDGTDALEIIKDHSKTSPIVIMATSRDIDFAVNSIKLGAFDYLSKPVDDEKILATIERILQGATAVESDEEAVEKCSVEPEDLFHGLVGCKDGLAEICNLITRIATARTTVLIRGESGTGKRLIAHAIHMADKKRRNKPFVEVSCGALPKDLIESELFGHIKGAFTGAINDRKGRFEIANGGTILLDDIDGLPLELQVKLLRVLQQKEFERVGDHKTMKVDTRIIASTNQDLEKLVADKQFREDLYYRLNVIALTIPPLRERKKDLPLLIDHFVEQYTKENHKKLKGLSIDMLDVLKNYDWPGNVRELENIIERAVILDVDGVLDTTDLPEMIIHKSTALAIQSHTISSHILRDVLKEPEKGHILHILKEVGWNKKRAAKRLGINRTTLYNKLRKYNILVANNNEL
ncbi:MAG: sigma-54 dependent transcriptional regulator [Candidatus Omnitrophota bacterium]